MQHIHGHRRHGGVASLAIVRAALGVATVSGHVTALAQDPAAQERAPPPPQTSAAKPASPEEPRSYPMPDEVVVSAERGVPLAYPGGRDVIERDLMDRYPDANIGTLLRRVPGVYFLPENGNDSRLNIGLRGNDPRRSSLTAVLIDGVPICEAPYGNTDIDGLPISFERIWRTDVIRGGASIRYGPNSAGGVINFLTEPVPDEPLLRVTARYGSDRDYAIASAAGGTWGDYGVLVSGVQKGGDGFREHSAFTDDDASVKMRYALNDADTLTWSISRFVELDAEQPGGLTQAAFDDDPGQSLRAGADFRFDANRYVVQFQHEVGPGSAWQMIGWWQDGFRGLFDFRPVVAPFEVRRVQESVFSSGALEARYTWTAELFGLPNAFYHSARYLVERNDEFYWRQPLTGGPRVEPFDLHALFKGRAFSFFNEDTVSLADNLDWALGCRVESIVMDGVSRDTGDQIVKDYGLFLPESNLTWKVRPLTALYASYQQNFYPPQYETGFDPASVLFAPTKPEYSDSYEVGTRCRELEGWQLSLALFETSFKDKIDFVNTSDGKKQAVNSGKALSGGVEVGAAYDVGAAIASLAGLSLYGSVTEMRSRIENGPNEGNDTPDAPHRLASFGVEYEHESGVWTRLGGSYSAKSFKDLANTDPGTADGVNGPVPAFTLWDLAIGWHEHPDRSGLSLATGVTNLFDEEYFRRFATGIYPGAPRQFFASVSYSLSF
ncbi:MAG: TonB-dependent receptor [Planctomycetota bacterium]